MPIKFTKARLYGYVACDQCEQWQYSLNDIPLQLYYSNYHRTHNVKQHPGYQGQRDIYMNHDKIWRSEREAYDIRK